MNDQKKHIWNIVLALIIPVAAEICFWVLFPDASPFFNFGIFMITILLAMLLGAIFLTINLMDLVIKFWHWINASFRYIVYNFLTEERELPDHYERQPHVRDSCKN